MELRTSYVLNTATQSAWRRVAWFVLFASVIGYLPARSASPESAFQWLTICLLGMIGGSIYLARSRAPTKGRVVSNQESITFDDDGVISRKDVVSGYWSPGVGRRGSGVTLLGKDEREIAWFAVDDRATGHRLLEHLGLGPMKRVIQFDAAATTLLAAFIRVGVDGVSFGTRAEARFIAWTDVKRVERTKRGAELRLKDGSRFELPLALRRVRGEELRLLQVALITLVNDALHAAHEHAAPEMSVQIARNGRPHADWVRALGAKDETSFREAPIRPDDLWRVVESPAAEPSARAAAAALLARAAGDEDRARLRIAADTCAEPKLRVVLDKAATGTDAFEALEELNAAPAPKPPAREA